MRWHYDAVPQHVLEVPAGMGKARQEVRVMMADDRRSRRSGALRGICVLHEYKTPQPNNDAPAVWFYCRFLCHA